MGFEPTTYIYITYTLVLLYITLVHIHYIYISSIIHYIYISTYTLVLPRPSFLHVWKCNISVCVRKAWNHSLRSLSPPPALQTLCAECGQRLSEVELRASGMPPVANRIVMLTQQLEELREFESGLVVVGNVLEKVISTQKKLVQVRSLGSCGSLYVRSTCM